MSKRKTSLIAAGIVASALFVASPALMASNSSGHYGGGHHGGQGHHGNQRDMTEMCDNMREGKGRFNMEERQAEMAKRRDATAERLKLNDEQRGIWNEIHEERRQQHEKRMGSWHKKMKQRCNNQKK